MGGTDNEEEKTDNTYRIAWIILERLVAVGLSGRGFGWGERGERSNWSGKTVN